MVFFSFFLRYWALMGTKLWFGNGGVYVMAPVMGSLIGAMVRKLRRSANR